MDRSKLDDPRDFVARQYASLLAQGVDEAQARERLGDVLGAAAVDALGGEGTGAASVSSAAGRVIDAVKREGGNPAMAQAELVRLLAEARLFALDWWRPIRSFLLYVLVLLALATVIATVNLLFVLPVFRNLDQTMGMRGDAVGWIVAHGALRLLAPLVLMALGLVLLAARWFRMRQRLAALEPLAGNPARHGDAAAFQALRCLEFAATIRSAGVADAAALASALQVAGWPEGEALTVDGHPLGERLLQAARLGTFAAELEWQRRVYWSTFQTRLELARDRLILGARVGFYLLIGCMVTALYLPIFSIASMMGVH